MSIYEVAVYFAFSMNTSVASEQGYQCFCYTIVPDQCSGAEKLIWESVLMQASFYVSSMKLINGICN